MNASQIAAAIVAGNFSDPEIREINAAVRFAYDKAVRAAPRQFKKGDRVQFKSRDGRIIEGTVEKVMQKNIRVKTDDGMGWRVGATLLTKI